MRAAEALQCELNQLKQLEHANLVLQSEARSGVGKGQLKLKAEGLKEKIVLVFCPHNGRRVQLAACLHCLIADATEDWKELHLKVLRESDTFKGLVGLSAVDRSSTGCQARCLTGAASSPIPSKQAGAACAQAQPSY